jgi:hypothetical protein
MALTPAAARAKNEQELKDFFTCYVADGSTRVFMAIPAGREIPLGLHDYNPAVSVRSVLTNDQMKDMIRLAVTAATMPQSVNPAMIAAYLCELSEKLVVDPINPLRDRMVVVEENGMARVVVGSALPFDLQLMYDNDHVNPFKPTAEFAHLYINMLLGFCAFPLRSMGLTLQMKLAEFVYRTMRSFTLKVTVSRQHGPGCQYVSGLELIHRTMRYADYKAGVVHKD